MSNPPPYSVGFSQPGYPPAQNYPPAQDFYPGAQGYAPPPHGQYPPPQGQYPPAQGQYPYPQGQYPPPQGQYPSPQGQYPPPQGQYAPPQGQYPPPQGYNPQPIISSQPQNYPHPGMGGERPDGWMGVPGGVPVNCPPGLEYLANIDQLLIHQKVELLEALTGFETANKFTVKNSLGQKVYYAVEDSGCCGRNCCGPIRPFDMKILDNYKNQVMELSRPLACQSCCFPCCLQTMDVFAPPGNLVGRIEQEWSILTPTFAIKNAAGDTVLKLEGPMCRFQLCGDVSFKVLSRDGSEVVGKISKQWAGLLREMFTDADYFGITFPMDLDVRMKAVMLGACFLIDYMFFEKMGQAENDTFGML